MSKLRDAAQQALEALEVFAHFYSDGNHAIDALKAALAEPQLEPAPGYCKHCKQYTVEEPLVAEPQEPVAWLIEYHDTGEKEVRFEAGSRGDKRTPLYASPQPSLDAAAIRAATLEEAAGVCEARSLADFPQTQTGLGFSFSQQWDAARTAEKQCAAAIRQLKDKT